VSTEDTGQAPETQLLALRQYAARLGFLGVGEYVKYTSGTREDRPRYRALLEVTRKRQVDVVLVWRYDRCARLTQALVYALKEVYSLGVDFVSYQEHIDTSTLLGENGLHRHGVTGTVRKRAHPRSGHVGDGSGQSPG
jgi:DNA invertase Pin-like site-specific DNA recombinase